MLLSCWLLACDSDGSRVEAAPGADTAADTAADTGDVAADTADTAADTGDTSDTSVDSDTGSSWELPERPDLDAPAADVSWRWGGGEGYPDAVDPTWPVVTRVSDRASLEAALGAAVAGDVVWVEDGAAIDLTGASLCVPAGVWLAGGRGQGGEGGALLYSTAGSSSPVLRACGDGVRITGLRLRGPDPDTCPAEWPDRCPEDVAGDPNCAYCTKTAYAIGTDGFDALEVDNNELSGWTYTAVGVKNAVGADVHHNHIHHGWREGLGYGVVLYGTGATTAIIRWNRFDAMRHAVAGQGYATEDYEARDNLVGTESIGHVFDMHGQDEATGDGSSAAGGDLRVHGNVVLVPDQYSFVVRGRPDTGAWFYDNCVAPAKASAYDQRYFTGNFWVDQAPDGSAAPNAYGQGASDCGTVRWCVADRASGPYAYGSASGTDVSGLRVGDFDGDGQDDVFSTTGSQWRWANPHGGSWAALATSGDALDDLGLADLDGDGVTDVFIATGAAWRWSRSGTGSWSTLRSSTLGLDDVRFGDFDGDGATDVFTSEGGRWYAYPSGSGAAVALASSGVDIAALQLGDFDGDGVADVFYADGTEWRWSRSGTSSWATLALASTTSVRLADVDGDGRTDVLGVSGHTLRWSRSGATSWADLRHQSEGLDDVLLGDFDGDAADDLLVGGCL